MIQIVGNSSEYHLDIDSFDSCYKDLSSLGYSFYNIAANGLSPGALILLICKFRILSHYSMDALFGSVQAQPVTLLPSGRDPILLIWPMVATGPVRSHSRSTRIFSSLHLRIAEDKLDVYATADSAAATLF